MQRHITMETVMAFGVSQGYGKVQTLLTNIQNGTQIILPNTKQARINAQKHLKRVLTHLNQTAPKHSSQVIAGMPAKAYHGTKWWVGSRR